MKETKRLAVCAVLLALALVLSYVERFIPLQMVIPLPGIKLGLANIVTLAALYLYGAREAVMILMLRCIMQAVFGGGISGFLFSAMGGLLAMGSMALAKKCSFFSVYGVSILGAAAHNIGQITAAVLFMQSVYVVFYLPYLLFVGIGTGFAVALATSGVLKGVAGANIGNGQT